MLDTKNILKNYFDLIILLLFFWVIVIFIFIQILIMNNGIFTYSLDDAYIHTAVAKNITKYGVWGINMDEFASCDSSILYPIMLAISYFIFGINDLIPFIINFVAANLIIIFLYYILKEKYKFPSYAVIIGITLIIMSCPLIVLIFTGMEHTLQILFSIIVFYYSAKILSKDPVNNDSKFSKDEIILFIFIFLTAITRFEGMALIGLITFLFLIKKEYKMSIIIAIVGFIPIIIFGGISILLGWNFLPNSVLLKGNLPDINSISGIMDALGYYGFKKLLEIPHLLILLIGASIIFFIQCYVRKELWNELTIMSFIFIIVTIFQIQFADTNIITRRDSYLVVMGIFLIILSLREHIPSKLSKRQIFDHIKEFRENLWTKALARELSLIFLIFFISSPFIYRAFAPLATSVQASNNIYDQQYQMAMFLNEYYQDDVIAANDIGAINYYTNIYCIDLVGLANNEVFEKKMTGEYNNETIDQITKAYNCKIAILYDSWFEIYSLPSQWIKAGEWTITNNVICAEDTVSFYAVDPSEISNLISNLQDFSDNLPSDVKESGLYT